MRRNDAATSSFLRQSVAPLPQQLHVPRWMHKILLPKSAHSTQFVVCFIEHATEVFVHFKCRDSHLVWRVVTRRTPPFLIDLNSLQSVLAANNRSPWSWGLLAALFFAARNVGGFAQSIAYKKRQFSLTNHVLRFSSTSDFHPFSRSLVESRYKTVETERYYYVASS